MVDLGTKDNRGKEDMERDLSQMVEQSILPSMEKGAISEKELNVNLLILEDDGGTVRYDASHSCA